MTPANRSLVRAVDRFAGTRVLVLGDAMLDSYLHGVPRALCREAPVPILDIAFRDDRPGGAANTAVNLAALGADVSLVALLGGDTEAEVVRAELERERVDTSMLVSDPDRRTLLKQRVLASDQMLARCDMGSTQPPGPASLAAVRERLRSAAAEADAVVVSDYGYGALSQAVFADLEELGRRSPTLLVVDAKDLSAYRRVQPTAITPNYGEAVRTLGLAELNPGEERLEQISARGPDLLAIAGAQIAAVTLDVDGAMSFERDAPAYRSYSDPRSSQRSAGAGDTFLAALCLGLAAGLDTPRAVDVASAAAAVVVEKEGTGTCSAGELRVRLTATEKVVPGVDALADRIDLARARGARIVFTNGCFDILHRGHITYLSQAKELGDVLVVGLNSDDGVRRLKGEGRPINRREDRAEVLAALSCVDLIVPFDQDTPIELVRRLRPDVYVKGGDYTVEALPEAPVVRELGGEVRLLPYVSERSTTGIIDRMTAASRPAGPPPGSPA
jgi:D-beta-D-heptose 7-phosphate kinase / D-beta-D-heptose 1-phosphate adenosyltransferase